MHTQLDDQLDPHLAYAPPATASAPQFLDATASPTDELAPPDAPDAPAESDASDAPTEPADLTASDSPVPRPRQIQVDPPPRSVPASLALNACFGGFNSTCAFGLAALGAVIVFAAAQFGDVTAWYDFRGPLDHAEVRLTDISPTRYSIGGDDYRDGTPIYAFDYAFVDGTGTRHTGRSFATGRQSRFKVGGLATIEFAHSDPSTARIIGLRRKPFGDIALLFLAGGLLLLSGGIAFAGAGLRDGVRAIRLLRGGQVTHAVCTSKRATLIKIAKRNVFRLTFVFTAQDGLEHKVICKTHLPESIEDEPREPLLYLPSEPDVAMLWDALPGGVSLTEAGQLQPVPFLNLIATLFLPTLLTAAAVAGLYAMLVPN